MMANIQNDPKDRVEIVRVRIRDAIDEAVRVGQGSGVRAAPVLNLADATKWPLQRVFLDKPHEENVIKVVVHIQVIAVKGGGLNPHRNPTLRDGTSP